MKIEKPLKSWDTRVPVSRSQESIREILSKFKVISVSFEEDFTSGTQILRFEYPIKEGVIVPIHFVIAIKGIYEWLQKYGKPSWNSEYRMKQAKKVAWRHIFDWVKANINLVEFGLIPFENIFLSYFSRVLPNGKYESLGEAILPKLYSGEFFNKLLPDKEED